jgi:hypothetical protein
MLLSHSLLELWMAEEREAPQEGPFVLHCHECRTRGIHCLLCHAFQNLVQISVGIAAVAQGRDMRIRNRVPLLFMLPHHGCHPTALQLRLPGIDGRDDANPLLHRRCGIEAEVLAVARADHLHHLR